MNKPLISVITVVFNNKEYLERNIQSVLNQTYDNVEHIIIDGGSIDGSLDIIRKYEDKLNWTSEKDNGLYDAMNKGIRKANGEWIHILNSDDYYYSNDALEKVVEKLDKNYFHYCTMIHEYAHKRKVYKHSPKGLNYSAYIPHMTLLVSKEQYEEIGEYDTSFKIAADHDFILRLMKRYKPRFVDIPLAVMRMGGLSSRNQIATFREFKQVTIKNGFNPFLAQLIFIFKVLKYKICTYLSI